MGGEVDVVNHLASGMMVILPVGEPGWNDRIGVHLGPLRGLTPACAVLAEHPVLVPRRSARHGDCLPVQWMTTHTAHK